MRTLWLFAILAACSTKDGNGDTDVDTDAGDTDVTVDGLTLTDVITVSTPPVGDFTCLPAPGTWLTQTIDPSCIVDVPIQGRVEDFESGDGVGDLTVELWLSDNLSGTADVSMTSDGDGNVSGGNAPTCTPWTSRVTSADDSTLPTIQEHWSDGPGTPMGAYFNSVSSSTLALMTTLLGVTPDPAMGVIAGTAYDCGGEGGDSLAENIQVIVRAADGSYPNTQDIRYFVDEFPNRQQTATSADGLWMIANIPPGDVVIEAYAAPEAGQPARLIAQTKAQVFAGALIISDVYTGSEDGVHLPASCSVDCASQRTR
jgi:hypothetical protein